jgi:hypothetical protein
MNRNLLSQLIPKHRLLSLTPDGPSSQPSVNQTRHLARRGKPIPDPHAFANALTLLGPHAIARCRVRATSAWSSRTLFTHQDLLAALPRAALYCCCRCRAKGCCCFCCCGCCCRRRCCCCCGYCCFCRCCSCCCCFRCCCCCCCPCCVK